MALFLDVAALRYRQHGRRVETK